MFFITPIIRHLLIINLIVFVGLLILPPAWSAMMAFWSPNTGQFQPFQIITYMFTHYGMAPWSETQRFDLSHIFFNMFGLAMLGPMVEMALGAKRFLGLYLISGLVALLAHFVTYYIPFWTGVTNESPEFVVYGASGCVYGVVIAFATLFPDRELMLLFPPIPIKAWVMALILIAIGLYSGLTGTGGNVAHFAHLGGALAGFILARHWKRGGSFLR